jgi:multidrug resistance efflux pump
MPGQTDISKCGMSTSAPASAKGSCWQKSKLRNSISNCARRRAELATAEANLNLSQITAARDENLLKTHSVSAQERDNAVNGNAANEATVQSNQANVARLEQLQS